MQRSWGLLVCALVVAISWSCGRDDGVGVTGDSAVMFAGVEMNGEALGSPGKVHNELIVALDRRRPMHRRDYVSVDDFVATFTSAVNGVLPRYEASRLIEEWEIRDAVRLVREVQAQGVYDFADPAHADPLAVITYLTHRGVLDTDEADALAGMIGRLPPADAPIVAVEDLPEPPPGTAPWSIRMADDILRHSTLLWKDVLGNQSGGNGDFEGSYNVINDYTGSTLADMAGALAGLEFGPAGSIIIGGLTSIWFYNSLGELNDDSSGMGDWPGPMWPSTGVNPPGP